MVGGPHAFVTLRTLLASTLVAVTGLLTACGGGPSNASRRSEPAEVPTRGFFDTSPDHFDAAIRASDGLPTVVNVWASWCIPCQAEAPLLRQAAERYEGRVRFLGLNTQDTLEDAEAFVEEFGLTYANGFDPDGKVMKHLKVLGLPTTYFYRPDGELALVHAGEIRREDLEEKMELLVLSSGR